MLDNGKITLKPDSNYTDNAKAVISLLNESYFTWEAEFLSAGVNGAPADLSSGDYDDDIIAIVEPG